MFRARWTKNAAYARKFRLAAEYDGFLHCNKQDGDVTGIDAGFGGLDGAQKMGRSPVIQANDRFSVCCGGARVVTETAMAGG
jgi:hypothetical protein